MRVVPSCTFTTQGSSIDSPNTFTRLRPSLLGSSSLGLGVRLLSMVLKFLQCIGKPDYFFSTLVFSWSILSLVHWALIACQGNGFMTYHFLFPTMIGMLLQQSTCNHNEVHEIAQNATYL